MTKTAVLILGSGVTTLGVLRLLQRQGIPAWIHGHPPGIEQHSRWYRPLFAPAAVPTKVHSLVDLLQACPLPRAVLLPCSDAWAEQVAALPAELRTRFPASVSSPEVMHKLVDKAAFGQLLAECGVPHPTTRTLAGPADLAAVDDAVLAGAFLKPHDSQRFFARYGVKAFQIGSRDEARQRLEDVAAAGLKVLLQEYIPGPGSLHYFVDGFVDARGRLRAAFARHRLRMYPPDFGNSSYMVSVAPAEAAQAIESLATVAARLGFRGILSGEFKRDPRDGTFKLIEINARAWWYVEFTGRCGVDVCHMAYLDALGQPVPQLTHYRVGERMTYPYYDYFACQRLHAAGELSRWDWARSWIGAQQPLFNWDDPSPAVQDAWATAGRRWLRLKPRADR